MNRKFPRQTSAQEPLGSEHAPRRVGKIVHDDRGMAQVEWQEAPPGQERLVLEIDESSATRDSKFRGGLEVLQIQPEKENFDPYESTAVRRKPVLPKKPSDLRKLSEWIKMVRELEERKKRGEDEE